MNGSDVLTIIAVSRSSEYSRYVISVSVRVRRDEGSGLFAPASSNFNKKFEFCNLWLPRRLFHVGSPTMIVDRELTLEADVSPRRGDVGHVL